MVWYKVESRSGELGCSSTVLHFVELGHCLFHLTFESTFNTPIINDKLPTIQSQLFNRPTLQLASLELTSQWGGPPICPKIYLQ